MKRTCKQCGLKQDVEKFPSAGVAKGKQYYRYLCVDCYYKSKEPRKKAIQEAYYELKKELCCDQCGNNDYRVLEFDHKDRNKKSFSVSDGVRRGFGIDRLKEEIAKCTVLCANCHRIETWNKVWNK